MQNLSDPYKDRWSNTPVNELMRQRPAGVTLIAVLMLIGAVLSFLTIIILPLYSNNFDWGLLLDDPIFRLTMFYTIIMIPISIILAIGLLMGKNWARLIVIIFEFISVIASLIVINLIGLLFPLIIIYYLTRPRVKDYFYNRQSIYWFFSFW